MVSPGLGSSFRVTQRTYLHAYFASQGSVVQWGANDLEPEKPQTSQDSSGKWGVNDLEPEQPQPGTDQEAECKANVSFVILLLASLSLSIDGMLSAVASSLVIRMPHLC
jgi:hypothetical protein